MFQQVFELFPKSRTNVAYSDRHSGHPPTVFLFAPALHVPVLNRRIRALSEDQDSAKIVVAIRASAYLYE